MELAENQVKNVPQPSGSSRGTVGAPPTTPTLGLSLHRGATAPSQRAPRDAMPRDIISEDRLGCLPSGLPAQGVGPTGAFEMNVGIGLGEGFGGGAAECGKQERGSREGSCPSHRVAMATPGREAGLHSCHRCQSKRPTEGHRFLNVTVTSTCRQHPVFGTCQHPSNHYWLESSPQDSTGPLLGFAPTTS